MTDNESQIVRELIESPLLILNISNQEIIDKLNNLIPYSTGFEIETSCRANCYNIDNFRAIPDIMYAGGSNDEYRYRIPNGIRGILCLYNISNQLKVSMELNPLSGIHYHVDCTDGFFKRINNSEFIDEYVDWILEELDTWNYKGTYNSRGISYSRAACGYWIKANDLSTLEYRIGEMTFEYSLLLKRIMHVNSITNRLKLKLEPTHVATFTELDKLKQIRYQKARLANDLQTEAKINNLEERVKQLELELDSKKQTDLIETQEGIQVRNRLHTIQTIFTKDNK